MTPPARPPEDPAPAAAAAVSFVAGIWLGAWSVTGAVASALLVCGCSALLALSPGRRRPPLLAAVCLLLLFSGAGFLLGRHRIAIPADRARAAFRALPRLPDRADRIEGTLVDFWTGDPPRVHGRLHAERIWRENAWRPFPADVFVFVSGAAPPARVADRGDRIVAVGHLQGEGPSPSERDLPLPWPVYRLSIKSALRVDKAAETVVSALSFPNRRLSALLPPRGARGEEFDRDVRGPLSSLLLGRTSELERGMVGRYRRGGLYHLLVVSGLHVVLAAGLAMWLLRALRVRGKRRDVLLLVAIFLFVLIGGANAPAVRAGLVFGIHRAARIMERPIGALQATGLSALILFAAAPAQIFSIGTILTFAAVCGIALFTAPIRRLLPERPRSAFSGIAAAVAAEIGTAPILLWRFNLVAAGAWLTAPVCVPLTGGLIALGGVLLALYGLGLPPGPVPNLFAFGSRALEWLADRASGVAFLRTTPPLLPIVLISGLTWLGALAPRRLRRVALAAAAVMFVVLALMPGPTGPERGFSLEALDVGQGDSLLLRWNRHAVLIDGGGPFDLEARDFGRTRLVPKLLDRGVTRLDAVLLTHPHPDHALGLFSVLEELPVRAFWHSDGEDDSGFYRNLERLAAARGVPARALRVGERVRWSDASLAILHSGGVRRKVDGINNQSVVALFERHGRRSLLTGDAGAPAEGELLRAGRPLTAEVLKIGHHGSRSSTTREFLDAVAPRAALISCGRENRFGHPAAETLRTLAARRVAVFRTDLSSDFRVELFPNATRLSWRGLF